MKTVETAMTQKQIQTITCALFHDGIDVEKLSEKAKVELRKAVGLLLSITPADRGGNNG